MEAKVILVSTSRKTAFPLEVAALRRLIAFQHHSGIQSNRTGGANIYSTYAKVAILTLHPNSLTRMEAQASRVAPVVRTSSTRRMWEPGGGRVRQRGLDSKAWLTLCQRFIRSFAVWVAVKDLLRSRLGRIFGADAQRESEQKALLIPRAMTSAWLYPRLLFFLQCNGTGTM